MKFLREKLSNPSIGVVLILTGLLLSGCGPKDDQENSDEDSASTVRVISSGGSDSRITIPIMMGTSSDGSSGLGLLANPSYVIDLEGCISGYTFTVTEADPVIKVYQFDRQCVAKLSELQLNGRTLIPTTGDPFTTWAPGDTATFDEVGEPGTFAVQVTVVANLSDPVTGTDLIHYQISDIAAGNDQDVQVASLAVAASTCCTVNALKANGVELTLTWSPWSDRYDLVELRRSSGTSPPADCASGTLVATFNTFTTATTTYTDGTGQAGSTFSYRACAKDVSSALIETATVSNVQSSNIQWMFVTSTSFASGGFGTAAAVANCQTLGQSIDNALSWTALLSDSAMEAAGRIPISGTVYNRSATPQIIASTYSGFWSNTLLAAPEFDETGASRNVAAWTGTDVGGFRSADRCSDWTDGTNAKNGARGTVNSLTAWLNGGTTACNSGTRRGYCLSKAIEPLTSFSVATPGTGNDGDVAVTVTFPADTTGWTKMEIRRSLGAQTPDSTCATGTLVKTYNGPTFTSETFTDATGAAKGYFRYVACLFKSSNVVARVSTSQAVKGFSSSPSHTIFVTSNDQYKGSQSGFTNMDAACQTAGDLLETGKTWRAIASTGTVAANSAGRIAATTTIRNINGQIVASNATDLFDGTIQTGVTYTEMGTDAGTSQVWTGTTSTGASATNHCSNFTSQNSNRRATYGVANATGAAWLSSDPTTDTCNQAKRFYCFSTTAY